MRAATFAAPWGDCFREVTQRLVDLVERSF